MTYKNPLSIPLINKLFMKCFLYCRLTLLKFYTGNSHYLQECSQQMQRRLLYMSLTMMPRLGWLLYGQISLLWGISMAFICSLPNLRLSWVSFSLTTLYKNTCEIIDYFFSASEGENICDSLFISFKLQNLMIFTSTVSTVWLQQVHKLSSLMPIIVIIKDVFKIYFATI